ncbi:MAG: hypothetical protein KAT71_05215, partial [Gammaproteobacteria bacterium]|nr:hypothetical protein [Gammaproteobacteria bacterium]
DFSSDFFLGAPKKIAKKRIPDKPVFAKVLAEEGKDKWHIQLKTQWQKGTVIQIMVPGMVRPTLAPAEYMLEDAKGNELSIAHPGSYAWFRAEHPKIRRELFLRLLARSD